MIKSNSQQVNEKVKIKKKKKIQYNDTIHLKAAYFWLNKPFDDAEEIEILAVLSKSSCLDCMSGLRSILFKLYFDEILQFLKVKSKRAFHHV